MNYKSLIAVIVQLFLLAAFKTDAQITSTFDTNSEGWIVVDICQDTVVPAQSPTLAPFYSFTNGHPGGFIWQDDNHTATCPGSSGPAWYFFQAPARYLGNRSTYYGGSLSFNIRRHLGSFNAFADVILEGAGSRLILGSRSASAVDVWTSYTVPLTTSSNWHTGSLTGAPPSEVEFQAVLANLTVLRIRGERNVGADSCDLDNVVLSPNAVCCPHSSIHASQVQVCWDSQLGARYQVQFRSVLTTNAWVDLGTPVAGNGTSNCVSDAIASPQQFYQVIVVP